MKEIVQAPFQFVVGDDLVLRGDVTVAADGQPKPVVIQVHGFKGFKDWGFNPYVSEALAASGFAAVRFNFTCNGVGRRDFDELHKFGANTYSREQADLAFLLQKLQAGELPLAPHLDIAHIALIGHSRGGGNALIFASEHPEIAAVITWNGIANVNLFPPSFEEEVRKNGIGYTVNARTKQQMPILPAFFDDIELNAARFDIASAIANLTTPVLTIQGDQDHEHLVRGHKLLTEASPQHRHVVIHGANHTFGAVHPFTGSTQALEEALRVSIDFLNEMWKE